MHLEVLIDQLSERDRRRSPARPEPLKNLLKRLQCVGRLAIRRLRLQLEHLALLDHLGTSSVDTWTEESHRDGALTTSLTEVPEPICLIPATQRVVS